MSVGAAGMRLHGLNAFTEQQPQEISTHGYLNRRCIYDPNMKKKERAWQTFWFSLKGSVLEFYKVDGIRVKAQGEPPPRDVLSPPNKMKIKIGFYEIDGAVVEVDYTYQENVDIQKRRKHLFRMELQNNTEFMFQAPSDDRRKTWVLALQASARRQSIGDEEMLGHSIKTSRCSIKQKSAHNVHSAYSSATKSLTTSVSQLDDPDYVDFSLAETMVSRDPRLRALKKRLQAKKQLLSQLNKMYTCFLGGNVAALYDDTLLHQQTEPLVIDDNHLHVQPATKQKGDKKVVHRRMSLPDPKPGGSGEADDEGDRRASTGDFSVPIITSVSPGVDSVTEGLETELLTDYYLIPGAEWSLLKKGDTIKVLGKAGADGRWYRCMALRDTDVKVPDLSLPPPSIVNALLPETIIGQDPEKGITKGAVSSSQRGHGGLGSSQLQRDVVMEDPLNEAMEEGMEGEEGEERVPTEEIDGQVEGGVAETEPGGKREAEGSGDIINKERGDAEQAGANSSSEDKISGENIDVQSGASSQITTERRLSYELATEEGMQPKRDGGDDEEKEGGGERDEIHAAKVVEELAPVRPQDNRQRKAGGGGKRIARSTSSPSAGARIKLQESLGLRSIPGVGAAHSPLLMRSSISTSRCGLSASFPSSGQKSESEEKPGASSRMAKLLESESQTGSYSCPLVGCIPASALKYFAEKEERKGLNSTSPQSSTSPSLVHEQSAVSLTSLDQTAPSPQPDTDTTDPIPVPVSQQNGTAEEEYSSGNGKQESQVSITVTSTGDEIEEDRVTDSPSPEEKSSPNSRLRARSLPPQLIYSPSPPPSPEKEENEGEEESSLDRSPSHLRRSPGFRTPEPPEPSSTHSVESTPVHASLQTSSPGKNDSASGRRSPSISSLFDSGSSKRSIFKKIFGRKPSSTKQRSMTDVDRTGARSPSPNLNTSLLKSVLLGNEIEDDLGPQDRIRVSSISGRPVRQDGVGIVIGNESSSESEDEADDTFQDESPLERPLSPTPKEVEREEEAEPVVMSKKLGTTRQLSGDLGTSSGLPPVSPTRNIPRSVSEHNSLNLRLKGAVSPELPEFKEAAKARAASLKRMRMASLKKTNKVSPKRKKRPSSEAYLTESESGTPTTDIMAPKLTGIFRQPPRGELRMVYLDPSEKYGFRLQSYGRIQEQGKVLQTFVQSVLPGSVSFMAGLYPGDAIVAINGQNVKYSPIDEVYEAIKNASKGSKRISLQVVFVDGVTRLDCMRKSDEVKKAMKEKQQELRDILAKERLHSSPPTTPLPSPQHIILAQDLPSWSETTPTTEPGPRPFPYNRHLNQVVSLHGGSITALECDALIMPLSSCFKSESEIENVLFHFLRNGGEELLDELSLARQNRVGDNIITRGHKLNTRYIYHCVFGNLEESLQSCCRKALERANRDELTSVVFWVDGFASLSVSPHLIVEAARQWLHEGTNGSKFQRIVFSAKANRSLIEKHMDDYFPLQPFATHDRTESEVSELDRAKEGMEAEASESDKMKDGMENGEVESDEHQNGIQNETEELDKDTQSTNLPPVQKRVSTVSIGAIDLEMGDEDTIKYQEPIPEDVELELEQEPEPEPKPDTERATNGTTDISVDNIELELEGVDAEMTNIQSLLLEMQQEQKQLKEETKSEELVGEADDEDPIGLLRFLGPSSSRSRAQEIVNTSSSLSAHTSPIHNVIGMSLQVADMQLLSQSLPLLDIEENFKLNPKREESDV